MLLFYVAYVTSEGHACAVSTYISQRKQCARAHLRQRKRGESFDLLLKLLPPRDQSRSAVFGEANIYMLTCVYLTKGGRSLRVVTPIIIIITPTTGECVRLTLSAEVSVNPTSSKVTSDRTAITSLNRESLKRRKKKTLSQRFKNIY